MKGKRMFFAPLVAFAMGGCTAQVPAESHASGGEAISPAQEAVVKLPPTVSTPAAAANGSLCASGETVLFSCETRMGKTASLCASHDVGADQGYLYYAFGSPGHPELVFPAEKRPPGDFKRTQLTFAGSTGGYAYSFENAGYRYIIYSVSGADSLEEQGVAITRGDARKVISALPCRNGSVIEDDDAKLLDLTFTWPADPDLDRHGLPTRK